MQIAIVTDSTADVPLPERSGHTISESNQTIAWVVLPEIWYLDNDQEIRDIGDIDDSLTNMALDSSKHPEPSEPSWDSFRDAYARLRDVDRVFSIHAPSSVSWAIEHAKEAAGGFPNVRVIEADVTGIGLGLLAVMARNLADSGASLDIVEAWLKAHCKAVRMLVVPDRFDPLHTQRGLTTRLLARSSGMLSSSDMDGSMGRSHRLRSRKATVTAIQRYIDQHTTENSNSLHLAIGHAGAAGAVDPFLNLIDQMRPLASIELVGRVGPRLVQQLGSRCVAAAWLEQQPFEA